MNPYFENFDEEMAYDRELHKQMKLNWSLGRWIRESQSYMSHAPKWWVAIRAVLKWPHFQKQQLRDAKLIALAKARATTPAKSAEVEK